MERLIANCLECTCEKKVRLCSISRNDFQRCPCGKVAIDGGYDYVKVSGEPEDYRLFTVYREYPELNLDEDE